VDGDNIAITDLIANYAVFPDNHSFALLRVYLQSRCAHDCVIVSFFNAVDRNSGVRSRSAFGCEQGVS